MLKIVQKLFRKNSRKSIYILVPALLLAASLSIYTSSQSATTTNVKNDSSVQIGTTYDYRATITPNILYPDGGTVEVGDTLFRKITTAIPFNLKSTLSSANEVIAKGTHEVRLVINAGDLWKKSFPLEQKQTFEQQGTDISILNNPYKIDLEKIGAFILQVEDETGISLPQYTIEVVPNIVGTIKYDGEEKTIQIEDKLTFQYSYDNIVLSSEKKFVSTTSFTTTEVITNTFKLMGISLPLTPVRIVSTVLSLLLLLTLLYTNKDFFSKRNTQSTSQIDKIHKKYGNRIIPVSKKENIAHKSIITLTSFKSVLKIADEKELPIFYHKIHQDGRAAFFIIDGDYFYTYETLKTELVRSSKKGVESDEIYGKD